MAPLLGRKPFPLVKPLPGEEPQFTIPHTQEAFRTREYPFSVRDVDARPGRGCAGRGMEMARCEWAARGSRGSCHRTGPSAGRDAPGPALPSWDLRGESHPALSSGPSRSRAPPSFSPYFVPGALLTIVAPIPTSPTWLRAPSD